MGAEFNWWLLIVGIVAGGALTWLVLADFARHDREISDEEVEAEAAWIARTLDSPEVDATIAEDVLRAHRRYLGFPPPDVLVTPDELATLEARGATAEPVELAVLPVDEDVMPGAGAVPAEVAKPGHAADAMAAREPAAPPDALPAPEPHEQDRLGA